MLVLRGEAPGRLDEALRSRRAVAGEAEALRHLLAVREREAIDGLGRGLAEGPGARGELVPGEEPHAGREPVVDGGEVLRREGVDDVEVEELVARLLPEPMVKAQGLPSFARVTVTSQPGRRIVHILSYVPERRGASIDMIEEPIELREVAVALRTEGVQPSRVYLAPSGQELPFESVDGYTHTTVPVVPGYAMVVFAESNIRSQRRDDDGAST